MDKQYKTTKFFVISDVHGAYVETCELLSKIGIIVDSNKGNIQINEKIRQARTCLFVGDVADRGPKVIKCFKLIMKLKEMGLAEMVLSNHDDRLRRYLMGNPVNIAGSFMVTVEKMKNTTEEFRAKLLNFLNNLPYKYETNEIVVAHAAYAEGLGKDERQVCLYGFKDEHKNKLKDWTNLYKGDKVVIVGHDVIGDIPIIHPVNTSGGVVVQIDGGCCYGGNLNGLLYPEMTTYSIKAKQEYYRKK